MAPKRRRVLANDESISAKKLKLRMAIHEFIINHQVFKEYVINKNFYEYCEFTTSTDKQDSFIDIAGVDFTCEDQICQFEVNPSIQYFILATEQNWFLLSFGENKQKLYEISPQCPEFTQSNLTICKHLKNKKHFDLKGYIKPTSKILNIKIYMHHRLIFNDYDIFIKELNCKNVPIMSVMSFIFGHEYYNESLTHQFADNGGIASFYDDMYNIQQQIHLKDETSLRVENLIPILYPYQESAVKWMLEREQCKIDYNMDYFVKHVFEDQELYYHELLGHFVSKEVYDQYRANHKIFPGGILADEMGLGKTVEMMALILSNKKTTVNNDFNAIVNQNNIFQFSQDPLKGFVQCHCGAAALDVSEDLSLEALKTNCLTDKFYLKGDLIKCLFCGHYQHLKCSSYDIGEEDFPYLCTRCWKHAPIDSACTLIVCPVSIIDQWISEFKRHVTGEIKIHQYLGVRNGYIVPPKLIKNNIVITTYDILQSELDFVSSFHGNFRNFKRYYYALTPLISINWWRLCFDEGQLVEGALTRTFKMANLLSSVNRWAVTGTPIQRGIQDLFGLFCFIRFEPYSNKVIWENALHQPFCNDNSGPLLSALSSCFWRTPKTAVEEGLQLLKPIKIEKKVDFSQIERDFYLSESIICKRSIVDILHHYPLDTKLTNLSQGTQSKVFALALRLRQICCHPQVIQNIRIPRSMDSECERREFGSMQDVLDKMIEDVKYDCEKLHREKINAMNGLAAFYLELKKCNLAVDVYRTALASIEKNSEYFRTDKTQIFHIYFNMAQVCEIFGCQQISPSGKGLPEDKDEFLTTNHKDLVAPVLCENDNLWRYRAQEVFQKYIAMMKQSCHSLHQSREQVTLKCDNLKKNSKLNLLWYIYALSELLNVYTDETDIIVVLGEMADFNIFSSNHEHTITTIKLRLTEYITQLQETRSAMLTLFGDFDIDTFAENSNLYINCHVMNKENTPLCLLCKAEAKFDEYEKLLFTVKIKKQILRRVMADDVIIGTDTTKERNWNENTQICWLRRIGQLFKTKVSKDVKDYKLTIEEMDNFFAYYEEIKKEFKLFRKYWTVLFEFINQTDELRQAQMRYVGFHLDDKSLETTEQHFKDEEESAEESLKITLGRLKYLINLKKNLKNKDNVESRVCSVCWVDLTTYVVIQCGHMLCKMCLGKLNPLKCPVCRTPFSKDDLTQVKPKVKEHEEPVKVVQGSCSTKLVHIVRCVKSILDSNEKIIIFSSWPSMLSLMETALKNNGMPCFNICGSSDRRFNEKIKNFRSTNAINVLLLPTNFACKGLNLTEASHVIFINSIINKADELQAIGRINRIGQTKQTYVHKFIIRDTIEELIENCSENVYHKKATSEYNNMTISDFYTLFSVYRAV